MSNNAQNSQLNTVVVPAIGTDNPATLYYAALQAIRVVVRNVGGTPLFISHEASTLSQTPPTNAGTFQLPAGASETFVLQPQQGIFAAGAGAGGLASIAASEALPTRWMES